MRIIQHLGTSTSIFKPFVSLLLVLILISMNIMSCDEKSDDEPHEGEGYDQPGDGYGPDGKSIMSGIEATVDLTGAFGLLVVDPEDTAALRLVGRHNDTVRRLNLTAPVFDSDAQPEEFRLKDYAAEGQVLFLENGEPFSFPTVKRRTMYATEEEPEAVLQKIDETTGEVEDALKQEVEESNAYDPNMKLPKLNTIAVSPTGEIYINFEQSYIYKDAPHEEDPWNQSNGYQCQIFKVAGGTVEDLLTIPPDRNNLTCIDNLHFIHSWRPTSNGVFQFNDSGDLYYPGSLPNSHKMVVYQYARSGSGLTEVINANICVENYLVTPLGGVFYTGQTCADDNGHGGGGGGFFRYVAPGTGGAIIEIARDWWNFIYDTAVTSSTATTNSVDTAVFFGPDPRDSSTSSWESACLFKFNPSEDDPTTRISEVITCGGGHGIWDWMELRRVVDVEEYGEGYHNYSGTDNFFTPTLAWKKEYKRRCETTDEVFAGEGSQISAIQQDSTGNVYVIGNIRKKEEGELRCSIEFRGPHCSIDGMPRLADADEDDYTEETCVADTGTWINKGWCSNGTNEGSCIDHQRSWTAGYCINPNYTTKASCEANTGCSAEWYNGSADSETNCTNDGFSWGSYKWMTGRCSVDDRKYLTQSACEGAGNTWYPDDWSGSCTSSDADENASLYNNDYNSCVPEWQTETVRYDNVTTDLCVTAETGVRSTWWEWDNEEHHFTKEAVAGKSQAYSSLAGKFIIDWFGCNQAGGGTGDWTTEYSSLAKVDQDNKSLVLLSTEKEKAIDLWLVNDKPYYSSFDTSLGQYIFSGLKTTTGECVLPDILTETDCSGTNQTWDDRRCLDSTYTTQDNCHESGYVWQIIHPYTIVTNFEAYNVAEAIDESDLIIDGLDFSNNTYKFGDINIDTGVISLKTGLTGAVKTVVILPRD